MENFLITMAGAAISGITFIAYKHPEFFEKEFSQKIFFISLGILFAAIFHDVGVSSAQQELTPFIKEGASSEVQEALRKANTKEYVIIAALGSILYSMFLSWLANHMKNENEKNFLTKNNE